jgi:hypothetical protein
MLALRRCRMTAPGRTEPNDDRLSSIHCGPSPRRDLNGGFQGTPTICPFESTGKSSAIARPSTCGQLGVDAAIIPALKPAPRQIAPDIDNPLSYAGYLAFHPM